MSRTYHNKSLPLLLPPKALKKLRQQQSLRQQVLSKQPLWFPEPEQPGWKPLG